MKHYLMKSYYVSIVNENSKFIVPDIIEKDMEIFDRYLQKNNDVFNTITNENEIKLRNILLKNGKLGLIINYFFNQITINQDYKEIPTLVFFYSLYFYKEIQGAYFENNSSFKTRTIMNL